MAKGPYIYPMYKGGVFRLNAGYKSADSVQMRKDFRKKQSHTCSRRVN